MFMFKREKKRIKLTGYFLETFATIIFIIMIVFYLSVVDNVSSVKQNLENLKETLAQPLFSEMGGFLGAISNLSLANLIISIVTVLLFLFFILYLLKTFMAIKEESLIDPLTGLYNRRFFTKMLGKELLRAKRFKHPLSVILLDIDHFKRYNDKYGHKVGDKVLKAVAGILRRSVRKVDTVFRYGGEEFAIVVPETNFNDVSKLAERVRSNVEKESKKIKSIRHHVTISLGVATYKKEYKLGKIVESADQLLYEAKGAGRNIVKKAYFGR